MTTLQRHPQNPILTPNEKHQWEHDGAFNGCVVQGPDGFHMVYRALSSVQKQDGRDMRVSSVGYAFSPDGVHFGEHHKLFGPTEDWEIYGCEDPRITYHNGKYYIFYTALSTYPFTAFGIKLAVAITTDFKTFEKHPVTTFNSKAMALFPEKINGKLAALLTINTDLPPAKIAFASFNREEDIWSPYYWQEWYDNANDHLIHLLRDMRDQVELGAVPIKTEAGWLVIYSYIHNYMSNNKEFGIEAVLLDLKDPQKVIGRTDYSLIKPEASYELHGDVPDIVFPSGALVHDGMLFVYYGAADTRCALATCAIDDLLHELAPHHVAHIPSENSHRQKFIRFEGNPIITPALELDWQARCVFNPAAIYENDTVHIVYRAQAMNGTSVFGYASSKDGFHIDENLDHPIYIPREPFEIKTHENGNSGCEDPRITRIGDRYYMFYTAYDGQNPPRVAMTSISVDDFLQKQWNWETPKLISLPGVDDKDACVVKGKKEGTYLAFHRLDVSIWLQIATSMDFSEENCLDGKVLAYPREDKWDDEKIGISAPPIETDQGWLLLYHGVSKPDKVYKVGAMLLDYNDPFEIIGRSEFPLFEPEMDYEKEGEVPNVVFPCGAVVIEDRLLIYYGGADKVIGVATMPLHSLLDGLTAEIKR